MRYKALPAFLALALVACQPPAPASPVADTGTGAAATVFARAETAATGRGGSIDPAIYIDASDPSNSMILGSAEEGGLELYTLDGKRVRQVSERSIGFVDVLYNFSLADEKLSLIVAYDLATAELIVYGLDARADGLRRLSVEPIQTETEIEGLCLYTSPLSGKFYAFAAGGGVIQQWELFDRAGEVAARQIRVVPVGAGAAHCVVHDRRSTLYFTQETVGVWKLSAEPESESAPQLIDFVEPNGRYAGDVKGIATYEFADGGGYLLVSDADASRLQVYSLETDEYAGTVSIVAGESIDGVEESEGLAATSMPLSDEFSDGLLVLADDDNESENTNFKIVAWSDIVRSVGLQTAAAADPRLEGDVRATTVSASIETTPVRSFGDAADDPAIWIHPDDPALSLIIGTQKKRGINVYDLAGNVLQERTDGRINNVDLRYGFRLAGNVVDVVTATNRSTQSIAIYVVDVAARALVEVSDGIVPTDMGDPYGLCMYHSRQSGNYYVFVNDTDGLVKQWVLEGNDAGLITARSVRQFSVGSQTEGCVVDDEHGSLYIGEEDVGIWKYSAEPDRGDARSAVDSVEDGEITDDVEGMAIYYGEDGAGYLIVSNQGADNYAVYERSGDNKYLGMFHVIADEATGVDGSSETDGLDVTSANLGASFPHGVFVAQDGRNIAPAERQNYKLVPWERIAEAMGLDVASGYDPRVVPTE